DEDEIVDAEHDLHRDQRDKGEPSRGIGGEREQIVHQGFYLGGFIFARVFRRDISQGNFCYGNCSASKHHWMRIPAEWTPLIVRKEWIFPGCHEFDPQTGE